MHIHIAPETKMTSRILILSVLAYLSLGLGIANPVGAQQDPEMAHQGPAMNFHRINAELATGGHFTDAGVDELAKQGVSLVIDLRDEPPEGQEDRLAAAGIRWVNVPVVWADPQARDFAAFSELMAANEDTSILVQCQANYRASAMTYLYRVTEGGVPEPEAREDLNAIWVPEGTWLAFIEDVLDSMGPKPAEQ